MRLAAGGDLTELQWGRSLSTAEMIAAMPERLVVRDTSMGPQPFDCGNSHLAGRPRAHIIHFNGAAAFRLRKFRSIWADLLNWMTLQWGRSLSTAEMCLIRDLLRFVETTSMGPQPFDCGNR